MTKSGIHASFHYRVPEATRGGIDCRPHLQSAARWPRLSAEKPAKTTVCTAPMRVQASMAMGSWHTCVRQLARSAPSYGLDLPTRTIARAVYGLPVSDAPQHHSCGCRDSTGSWFTPHAHSGQLHT